MIIIHGMDKQARDLQEQFANQGFVVVADAVPLTLLETLRQEADRLAATGACRGGVRNLLQRSDLLRHAGEDGPIAALARKLLDAAARPTKLTLFNKTAEANWKIRWHQDLNIAVRERHDVPGFFAWSVKEGVHHVRPPVSVLSAVVALRVHLDDTPADNGALRVVPGSHQQGRLSREDVTRCREDLGEVVCEVPTGGAMAMSPLLLHASSKSLVPGNRRVLHFEYSAQSLPDGLAWA